MKRLWIAAALQAEEAGLCIGTARYHHRRAEALLGTLERLEAAYTAGEQDRALALAELLVADFERADRVMSCFVAHGDLAAARETVGLLPALVRHGDEAELWMEISRLRRALTHLRTVNDPLLHNLL